MSIGIFIASKLPSIYDKSGYNFLNLELYSFVSSNFEICSGNVPFFNCFADLSEFTDYIRAEVSVFDF